MLEKEKEAEMEMELISRFLARMFVLVVFLVHSVFLCNVVTSIPRLRNGE